jgi:hypothetical protein
MEIVWVGGGGLCRLNLQVQVSVLSLSPSLLCLSVPLFVHSFISQVLLTTSHNTLGWIVSA